MKYLKLYKNIKQYNADFPTPEEIEVGQVSYIRTDFKTGDVVKYKNSPRPQSMVMYVDDLPDGINDWSGYEVPYDTEYVEEFYLYPTIEDYLTAYIKVPQGFGGSKYVYKGETLEYDGDTYYLWEFENTLTNQLNNTYCLTETDDFNTLYNLSVESNLSNRNCVIYLIDNDGTEYFPQEYAEEFPHEYSDTLIKVERYAEKTPLMRMWIDDFPDGTDEGYEPYDDEWANDFYNHDTMDDYLDDYFSDPETFGSNMFNYYGETIEYDGDTYYLWEFMGQEGGGYWQGSPLYCLTTTIDYNTLSNMSIENAGISHQSTPVVYTLQGDLEAYNNGLDTGKVLVMVENLQN